MRTFLLLFLVCLFVAGCDRTSGPELERMEDDELNGILTQLNEYSNSGQYARFLEVAVPLYRQSAADGDEREQVLFGTGVAEVYARMDMPDSTLAFLRRVLPIALEHGDRDALVMIYNTFAMYSIYYRINYNDAVDYLMKALSYSDTAANGLDNYMRITNNLAHVHNLRFDTMGMRYSQEVYRAGHRYGNDYWTYIGSINTATQLCIRRDFGEALDYIREAETLTHKYHSTVEVYYVYADILAGLGRREEAGEYYRKAIALSGNVEAAVRCGLFRSYGDFLMEDWNWAKAAEAYRKGISIAEKAGSYMYLHELYLGLSEACGRMGDLQGELDNFKHYHYLSDSVFNVEKERAMNEMWVRYDTEKKERMLQQQEVELMKKNRRLMASAFTIALLAVTAGLLTVLYVRRKLMYKQLVLRHYENFQLARKLKDSAPPPEPELKPETDVPGPGQSGHEDSPAVPETDRLKPLFDRITQMMELDKAYRDSTISVESLAKALQTNRTYVSSAVNQYAGTTFKNWINSLRISEAVEILSDPDKDIPLKAMYAELGFNSSSAFYRAFQNATGVPPSQYRKEARRIRAEQQIS